MTLAQTRLRGRSSHLDLEEIGMLLPYVVAVGYLARREAGVCARPTGCEALSPFLLCIFRSSFSNPSSMHAMYP